MFNRNSSPRQTLNPWQGTATVYETIHPKRPGRVLFNGTPWRAKSQNGQTIPSGAIVEVCDRQGITLIVKAI